MGFKSWLSNIASKFQPVYDRIDKLDFPPEIKEKLQTLSDALPKKIREDLTKKVLWFCTTAMEKYGKKFVQSILNTIVEFIKTSAEGIAKKDSE